MIKRTLYFGNPAYLSMKNLQLEIRLLKEAEENIENKVVTVPIEDIGVVILDHQQITITHSLIASLLENNVALITCDDKHLPTGLMLPLSVHSIQSQRFQYQIEAKEVLKKQLWQQTISTKIANQLSVLKEKNVEVGNMLRWARSVKTGDRENHEAKAAAYYWKSIFAEKFYFYRERFGLPPNNLLNYGYAILRATVARSLVGSGLLPTLGIHHHNKYNAYCLADDIMEPYRPFIDKMVLQIIENGEDFSELSLSIKKQLLTIPTIDVWIEEETHPLMIGVHRTTASLAQVFKGEKQNIVYPKFIKCD